VNLVEDRNKSKSPSEGGATNKSLPRDLVSEIWFELVEEIKRLSVKKPYETDIVRTAIKASDLKNLMKKHPLCFDLEERQNDSPTFGDFITLANDDDILEIYVVLPPRLDTRVNIEGIITTQEIAQKLRKLAFNPPDVWEILEDGRVYMWWD